MPFDSAPERNPKLADAWRRLLWDAADLIEKKGHIKGQLGDDRNGFCAIGALLRVSGNPDYLGAEGDAAMAHDALRRRVWRDFKFMGVPAWNNQLCTTGRHVIDTMRSVALED